MKWSWYRGDTLCQIASIVHYASDEKVGTTTEFYTITIFHAKLIEYYGVRGVNDSPA